MAGWLNWLILLAGLSTVFVAWSWVPLERLDRYWSWTNPIGRPLADTLVLTGLPALYAGLTDTPWPLLLIPITFFLTQYAVLTGRFLPKQFFIGGCVMVIATIAIWIVFLVW